MLKKNIILIILSLELFGCSYFEKQSSDIKTDCAITISRQSIKQLIQCAQSGDAVSQYNLGVKYRDGIRVSCRVPRFGPCATRSIWTTI